MRDDICFAEATELVARIRGKELSPVEVVDAFLEQIDLLNRTINALPFVLHEDARRQAREAEAAVLSGTELGALHGVPITFKDVTPTKGVETTSGSWVFKGHIPEKDAIIVERSREAGAILIGKTATPEFAQGGFTRNLLFGLTLNPWNFERTTGGSSGGAAAAVASGMTPLADGTDGGGSNRIPASCCGVVGMKPSFGRIPYDISEMGFETLLNFGPITRTVRDAALALSVWAGPDDRDPLSLPASNEDYVSRLDGDLGLVKVAYSPDLGAHVDPRVDRVVRKAVDQLADLGCSVEEVEITGTEEAELAWNHLWWPLFTTQFERYVPEHGHHMTRRNVELIEMGRTLSAADYLRAQMVRTRYYDQFRKLLAEYDFLVAPTCAVPPPTADRFALGPDEIDGKPVDPQSGWILTWQFNLTLNPALSVPCGFTDDGLPIGMQIVGGRFGDADVLHLAACFEEAMPWRDRRPPAVEALKPATS